MIILILWLIMKRIENIIWFKISPFRNIQFYQSPPFNVHTFSNTCTVYTDDNGLLHQHFKLCQEYLHMYTMCLIKQTKSLKCIKWYLGCTLNTNIWISIRSNEQVSKLYIIINIFLIQSCLFWDQFVFKRWQFKDSNIP